MVLEDFTITEKAPTRTLSRCLLCDYEPSCGPSWSLLVSLCTTLNSALFRHTIPEEENGHAAGEAAGRQQIYVGLPFLMLIDIELFLKSPNSHKYFQKE